MQHSNCKDTASQNFVKSGVSALLISCGRAAGTSVFDAEETVSRSQKCQKTRLELWKTHKAFLSGQLAPFHLQSASVSVIYAHGSILNPTINLVSYWLCSNLANMTNELVTWCKLCPALSAPRWHRGWLPNATLCYFICFSCFLRPITGHF